MPHTPPVQAASLAAVKLQFKTWRDTRKQKSRIPAELWTAAVSLSNRYSVHHISKALHVNHTALRDKVSAYKTDRSKEAHSCFIELPLPRSPASECLIEMENRSGEKMRMHFSGRFSLDLLALSQNFWEKSS